MRSCKKCGATKPINDFYLVRRGERARHSTCKDCVKTSVSAYKRQNPEKVRSWVKAYDARNPERTRARVDRRAERARIAAGGPFSPQREDYKQRWAYFGGLCAYCREPAAVFDHAIPLSRGGSNFAANIYPACALCNQRKHTKKLGTEWVPPLDRKNDPA